MSQPERAAHEALFDIHPVTGASIEVFYADRSLETFGWRGAGWFWCLVGADFSSGSWSVPYLLLSVSARDAHGGGDQPLMREHLANRASLPCAEYGTRTSRHTMLRRQKASYSLAFVELAHMGTIWTTGA